MVEFSQAGPPTDEQAIQSFEQKIGRPLPRPYRSFLLRQNGGRPSLDACDYKDAQGPESEVVVEYFYSIDDDVSRAYERLDAAFDRRQGRMPSNLIPIASDPFGNEICLSVDGKDAGRVYFWDHENEASDGETPDYRNLHLLADDFDEFLTRLREE